ncbi:MAG: hypothetical protein FWC96_03750 [Oscillospiraceae bacterium]|nr:hypothetical protein [Oscillospiraceae bacterium]
MKNFSGKIAFITGGASGAGLGQAKVFAKAGMKVTIADMRRRGDCYLPGQHQLRYR